MTRLRADYVFGTLDTALTDTGTTMSAPALARLPVVTAPDVAALVLGNPLTGAYEIVHVTAHAATAATATVVRAQEGSSAAAWPAGAGWWHGATAQDFEPPDVEPVEPATVPTSLLSDKYQGAWDAETEYIAGQTVVFEGRLWEALVNDPNVVSPGGPGVVEEEVSLVPIGGPDTGTTYNFSQFCSTKWTFSDAGTLVKVRVSLLNNDAPCRIGVSTTRPDNPTTAVFLASALCNGAGTPGTYGADVDLDEPVEYGPGTELWITTVIDGPSQCMTCDHGGAMIGPVAHGTNYYFDSGSWSSYGSGWNFGIQFLSEVASAAGFTGYAGGPDDTAGAATTVNCHAVSQSVTFAEAATFETVRVKAAAYSGGTYRVGYSATDPVSADTVSWLCYADVPVGYPAVYSAEVALSTPLVVTAGQTVYVLIIRNGAADQGHRWLPTSSEPVGGVVLGSAKTSNDASEALGYPTAHHLPIQVHASGAAGDPFEPAWGLALDLG